ncbi:MAG: MBL fold metallo-hydrolase, partial [Candidatus Sabulitectum sp.]|nr:MBL fold metallo-hydrolase [Candidatus Sabulitectum sp.]
FRTQARQVNEALTSRGLKLTHVLLTHFHPDHVAGLVALDPKITVLGSLEYKKTLVKEIPQTVTHVSFSEGFVFGDFNLSFTPAPGHSPCSILIDINGKYLHAGDNLMSRYDGKAILPWVEFDQLGNHISSLEMLKAMGREKVILAHGSALLNSGEINQAIDDRLSYLSAVLRSSGNCSWEDAVSGCTCHFAGKEFFEQLVQ